MMNRRQWLASAAVFGVLPQSFAEDLPPIRAITKGPKHHWFGYYDKWQFDTNDRFVLGMRVDFEHRSPRAEDRIDIGMIDLQEKDQWIPLGTSNAWGWQQGCMLQWVPGIPDLVIWNDRIQDRFVSRLLNLKTMQMNILEQPVYALSPDGKIAISTDFRRLNEVRPGYGYAGIADPNREVLRPENAGIWKTDVATGKTELLLSIQDVVKYGPQLPDMSNAKHWFNHLLFNTDGTRFVFLHRWRPTNSKAAFRTRMITANLDGSNLYVIDPSGYTSHFIWRDPKHLLAWTRPLGQKDGFYLFEDHTEKVQVVGPGIMTVNGHCTYLPGNQWILNDTYPDKDRLQHPYLFEIATKNRIPLGHFHSPPEYQNEWRCDTHPRYSRSGKFVCIDSPHGGTGRQLYLIDIRRYI